MKRWATAIACIVGRAQVGVITSGYPLAGLEEDHRARSALTSSSGELGTQLEVGKLDGEQKRLPGRVVRSRISIGRRTRARS